MRINTNDYISKIFLKIQKTFLRIYQVVRGYFYCSKNIKIKELIIWTLNYTLSQVSAPTTFYSVSRSLWIHLCPNYIHSLEWKNPDYLFWTATSGFNIQPKIGSLGLLEIWITNNIRYPGPNYIVKKLCKVSRVLPNVEKMQTYPDFESLCLCFFLWCLFSFMWNSPNINKRGVNKEILVSPFFRS